MDVEHWDSSDLPQEPVRGSFLAGGHQDSNRFWEVLPNQLGVGEGVDGVDPKQPLTLFVGQFHHVSLERKKNEE